MRRVLLLAGLAVGFWLLTVLLHAAPAGAQAEKPSGHPVAKSHRVPAATTTLDATVRAVAGAARDTAAAPVTRPAHTPHVVRTVHTVVTRAARSVRTEVAATAGRVQHTAHSVIATTTRLVRHTTTHVVTSTTGTTGQALGTTTQHAIRPVVRLDAAAPVGRCASRTCTAPAGVRSLAVASAVSAPVAATGSVDSSTHTAPASVLITGHRAAPGAQREPHVPTPTTPCGPGAPAPVAPAAQQNAPEHPAATTSAAPRTELRPRRGRYALDVLAPGDVAGSDPSFSPD